MTARHPPRQCPLPRCTHRSQAWHQPSTSTAAGVHLFRLRLARRILYPGTGRGTRSSSSRRIHLSSQTTRTSNRTAADILEPWDHGDTRRRRRDTEARVPWRMAYQLRMRIIINLGINGLGRFEIVSKQTSRRCDKPDEERRHVLR